MILYKEIALAKKNQTEDNKGDRIKVFNSNQATTQGGSIIKTLYISDLDGTLLRSDDRLSTYTIQTIHALQSQNATFSYATARSLTSAAVVTTGLVLTNPVVVYNGAFIVDPNTKEILLQHTFTGEEISFVSQWLQEHQIYPLVYSFVDGIERVSWLCGKENEGMLHYLNNRKGDKRLRKVTTEEDLYKGEVFYFTCIGSYDALCKIVDDCKGNQHYTLIMQQELYRTEYWCEIMPKKATKANAILELKKILHCDRVISFGDAINDLSMFGISDACYAVANAKDEVKQKATAIIGSNDDDGVARWLMKSVL